MTKELSINEVKILFETLYSNWEEYRKDLHLSGKSTFNLISLKKELENQAKLMQETIFALGAELGGHADDNGGYRVPPDKVDEMNQKLIEFGESTVNIEYEPMVIHENDYMNPDLMDLLFAFVQCAE